MNTKSTSQSSNCVHCGEGYVDGNFCKECGNPFVSDPPHGECPECNYPLKWNKGRLICEACSEGQAYAEDWIWGIEDFDPNPDPYGPLQEWRMYES